MGPLIVARVLLVASTIAFPLAAAAQSVTPGAGTPQTDEQKRGEAIFHKNCHLCHIFTNQKREVSVQATTELVGLFKKPTTTEERCTAAGSAGAAAVDAEL